MTFEDTVKQSELLHLVTAITSRLESSAWMEVNQRTWTARCGGLLNLSHNNVRTNTCAKCLFVVHHDWANTMPCVCCLEPWIKKGDPDWHVGPDGTLCYELDSRWKDDVVQVVKEHGPMKAAAFAATWCLESSRWLLYRHRYAYERNIVTWPKEWPFWKHGIDGRREYRWLKGGQIEEVYGL